jgi:S-adenosylmethionine:tRNA ribosyltransferase-isomerase
MKDARRLPAKGKDMQKNGMILNERPETNLETHDFYYDLPEELIAQYPSEERDGCRLMVLNRENQTVEHKIFRDIIEYLRPEDMLVVNSSKVIPARLLGITEKTGSGMELLLLRMLEDGTWETLVRPGKRAKVGARFNFSDILYAEVVDVVEGGNRIVRFEYNTEEYKSIYEVLDKIGNMPLPPYITKKLENKSDYQTVYAKEEGSAAAPTAGLHFTDDLLARIKEKGVGYGEVTLHVGLGTFRPVKVEKLSEHEMHGEYFHIEKDVADEINRRRANGGRIIAVGTTSCRVLESVATSDGLVHATSGETGIFIYPGYKFKAIDALITNFHLPESTLIMLVSALAGKEFVMGAYEEAVNERYRFFSFGDAMLVE